MNIKKMGSLLRDKDKWKEVREKAEYESLRKMLWDGYNEFCVDVEFPAITFSDEMDFFRTGTRVNFENLYFLRRRQLTIYAMLTVIYPEQSEYLDKLQDIIWEICNEHSWQLPAHRGADWLDKRDGIDLFAAETGLYLAEIKQMLIERLDPVVIDKITTELNKRILESFERETFWFEGVRSNWASVCGGSVGITFMYESLERFEAIKDRIDLCMEHYLEGIGEDGTTSEGVDYWCYGFTFFVMYSDVRRRNTYGFVDKFSSEKVRKLSGFLTANFLDEENIVSFSDASSKGGYPLWTVHFLKKEYDIEMPPFEKGILSFNKFSSTVRGFLYYSPEYISHTVANGETYYEQVQWYIKRTDNYSFAVKGGHNGEEHNHNDVGSFIVTSNQQQILCDLGAPEYTATSFGEGRYSILNVSSLGHSVPIVNGYAQKEGKEYNGKLTVDGNVISVDMKKAYPCEIEKLLRKFELSDTAITMTDSFEGADVVERFVTECEPQIKDKKIIIGNAVIGYDTAWEASYTSQEIMSHDGKTPRTVYLIDFTKFTECNSFTAKITFE